MSQENLERFTAVTEAFNRIAETPDDLDNHLQDLLGGLDSEVQFHPQQAALEGGYAGHEGVMRWLLDLAEHYEGGELRFADVRDLGDRVLALGTLHVIGRGSGIAIDVPSAVVATFRGGLIIEFRDHGDGAEALEAVGLSE